MKALLRNEQCFFLVLNKLKIIGFYILLLYIYSFDLTRILQI